MKCSDLITKLEELSPVRYAEEWDNVGLLVGRMEKEVRSVYIALDATDEVIHRALVQGADLILTHHPMIFTPIKRIVAEDFIGRRIIELIRNDLCLYAMHTNFDVMGMADAAADELGLRKCSVLQVTYEDEVAKEGFGRVGKLPQIMSLEECATLVKERFRLEHVEIYGDPDTTVEMAAILPGSGASMTDAAVAANADVYISGDIGHHTGIDLNAKGVAVINAGHFGIEKLFIPYMREYLQREFTDLNVLTHPCTAPSRIV